MAATDLMRPMTEAKLRAHLQRTLKRALEMGLAEQVQRLEYGHYTVPSTSRRGILYFLSGVEEQPLTCTCEAQEHTPYCVHKAAVQIRRWRLAGMRVTLNDVGDVVVVTEQDAAKLAYPAEQWPALVDDAPPTPPTPPPPDDDDLVLELDDDAELP